MTRGAAWFAIAGLFLAGVVIGVLGTLLLAESAGQPPWGPGPGERGMGRGGGAGPPDAMHLERLARQLELTDEQRNRIETILDAVRLESESLRRELKPRLEALMLRTDELIRAELEDGQRAKFDQMRERNRGMMERFFVGGRGGRRPPPGFGRSPRPEGRRRPPAAQGGGS